MNAQLLTLYGEDDFSDDSYGLSGEDINDIVGSGDYRTVNIIEKWPSLSLRQKQMVADLHPELMGSLTVGILSAVGAGVKKLGPKLAKNIKRKISFNKKKKKAKKEAAKIATQTSIPVAPAAAPVAPVATVQPANNSKMLMIALPVAALAALLLLKGKK